MRTCRECYSSSCNRFELGGKGLTIVTRGLAWGVSVSKHGRGENSHRWKGLLTVMHDRWESQAELEGFGKSLRGGFCKYQRSLSQVEDSICVAADYKKAIWTLADSFAAV
jgi:hypothetical protein